MENQKSSETINYQQSLKFCKFCGEKINMDAVICTECGRQVEELKNDQQQFNNGYQQPNIIINNESSATNINTNNIGGQGNSKNKMIALLLCIFLGYFGAHKFYEGKTLMGIIYIFTMGLFFIGVIFDFIALLSKPSIYYV